MQVDAIVNAASRHPHFNAGVDSAIHKAAGPQLLQARKEIGYIAPGSAAITPAFALDARFVIHAVTPIWAGGLCGEAAALRKTYDSALALAMQHGCDSVAFPLLASGNNGFPKTKALQVAISAFSEFLLEHEIQIYLVVFGKESFQLSEKLVSGVRSYIDENYVTRYEEALPDTALNRRYSDLLKMEAQCPRPCAPAPRRTAPLSLDAYISKKDAGFTETLLELIKKSGQKNSAIYKKTNISKQHFSKLLNDPDAKPSKQTAIALALALELDLKGTKDLIGRAGFALTASSTFDLIIQYFIEHKQYNVIEINIALYEFDQPLLGG